MTSRFGRSVLLGGLLIGGLPLVTAAPATAAGPPAWVTVGLNPTHIPADGVTRTTVTVTVRDAAGIGVVNEPVRLTTSGDVKFASAVGITGAGGVYTTTATASTSWGTELIRAQATTRTVSGSATLTEYGAPATVSVALSPAFIPPDGVSTSTATVTVRDGIGNGVANAVPSLGTSGDVAISTITNNHNGTYVATVTASTTQGVETITATVGTKSGAAALTEYGAPATLTVSLAPSSIPATGASTSTATARVADSTGGGVPTQTVAFSTNGDVGFGPVTNNGDGTYRTTITSSTTPGPEVITATATPSGRQGSATLTETFGALHTSGNQILDATNTPVALRGIHRDGLEVSTQTYDPRADWNNNVQPHPITAAELDVAKAWNANIIRVPLAEYWWNRACPIENPDYKYDPNYQAQVDQVVQWIKARGMLALLDLHTTVRTDCDPAPTVMRPLPDRAGATKFWREVATKYKNDPLVAFELYNEPHVCKGTNPLGDGVTTWNGPGCVSDLNAHRFLWRDGGMVLDDGVRYQAAGLKELYDTVRATGANNLVFIGANWTAGDPTVFGTSGAYSMFPTTNAVYAQHPYTCSQTYGGQPNAYSQTYRYCQQDPANSSCTKVATKLDNFQTADVQQHPTVITEFGWPDRTMSEYIHNAVSHMRSADGWIAFAWDGWNLGEFGLLAAETPDPLDATVSGQPIRDALSGVYPGTPC